MARDPLRTDWSGRIVQEARAIVATWLPAECAKGCGRVLDASDPTSWVVGHKKARATHPELMLEVSNWQAECRPCSDASGHSVMVEKAVLAAGAARRVILVCGPPGAGKTTYATSTGLRVYDRDADGWDSEPAFLAALAAVGTDPHAQAVVIRSGPTRAARDKWASLIDATERVMIDPGQDETTRRVRSRGRSVGPKVTAVAEWYGKFEADGPATDLTPILPTAPSPSQLQRRPISPPEGPSMQMALPGMPKPPTGDPIDVRPELLWDADRLAAFPWLTEIVRNIPDDASPPLYMSPPPAAAVGSYGQDVIDWYEREFGVRFRWWQRLATIRQFEHRADGSLCCELMLDSAPRRAGKSVRLRGVTLWRLEDPLGLFAVEPQLAMHTGSDMAICREIQRGAWRWAEAQGWEVTRANGKEAVETPGGDRWLVRSQDGVYGYDVTYGLVDEAWNVKPETVTEGLEPATLERHWPQMHLTSTAHRRATSLMRGRISTALAVDDPSVVLILWAAPAGSDPGNPDVWRAASPHWSEDRRKLIARKYEAALAGQADPQADDPDPLAGFASQYLNIWRLNERAATTGDPITDEPTWATLGALVPDGPPISAAIESWFGAGVSLAVAWNLGDRAVVSVSDHRDLATALAALIVTGHRGDIAVGASLAGDPVLAKRRVKPMTTPITAALAGFGGLLREDAMRHDGSPHLTSQVLALRTRKSANGVTLISKERADAVKAAVWAADAARVARPRKRRIITASS